MSLTLTGGGGGARERKKEFYYEEKMKGKANNEKGDSRCGVSCNVSFYCEKVLLVLQVLGE